MLMGIFVGNLGSGFSLDAVIGEEQAGSIPVVDQSGRMNCLLGVQAPSSHDKNRKDDESGRHFIVFGQGLGGGFALFGPFAEYDDAEEFGEEHRDEDEEWEIFTLS